MIRGRNLTTTMLLAASIILIGSRGSEAQDQTPSPRMLLNLDLFTAQTDGGQPSQNSGGGDSMLEQLRSLRAMGYLSSDGPLPAVVDDPDDPPTQAKSRGAQQ